THLQRARRQAGVRRLVAHHPPRRQARLARAPAAGRPLLPLPRGHDPRRGAGQPARAAPAAPAARTPARVAEDLLRIAVGTLDTSWTPTSRALRSRSPTSRSRTTRWRWF